MIHEGNIPSLSVHMNMKITKLVSQSVWKRGSHKGWKNLIQRLTLSPAYFAIFASSIQWSAKSWTRMTKEPILKENYGTFVRLNSQKGSCLRIWESLKFVFFWKVSKVLPEHLCCPAECKQGQRRQVVYKHLREVLPLYVRELGEEQRPVEGHLEHVVPPNCTIWTGVFALVWAF